MNKTILATILIISLLMTGCGVDSDKMCSDDKQNQDESDIDCGGICSPCEDGKACTSDDDCANKCSQNSLCYKPIQKTTTTKPSTVAKAEAELTDDAITKIENKLKSNLMGALSISENFKSVSVGDSYTVGFGIINVYPQTYHFKIELELDKAIDSYSNSIQGVDPEYVNAWLSDSEFWFKLDQSQVEMVPLVVKVGKEMGDGVPTAKGSYTYNVRTFYGDDASLVESVNEKYVSKQTLTVRVK